MIYVKAFGKKLYIDFIQIFPVAKFSPVIEIIIRKSKNSDKTSQIGKIEAKVWYSDYNKIYLLIWSIGYVETYYLFEFLAF